MLNLSKDQIGSIFSNVLAEVVSKTTGISLNIIEKDNGLDELIGLVNLNGNNHGMILISAGYATIRTLSASMTGVLRNEVTKDDIHDTLCELVNMTAGNAKLRFNSAEEMYTLSPPFIISGEDMSIISKNRVNLITRCLTGEGITLKLNIVFY